LFEPSLLLEPLVLLIFFFNLLVLCFLLLNLNKAY